MALTVTICEPLILVAIFTLSDCGCLYCHYCSSYHISFVNEIINIMSGAMIGLFLILHVEVLESTYRDILLHGVDNPYTTLWSSSAALTTDLSTRSISECATKCLEQNSTCSAISFESTNGTCTMGICAITQPVTRSPSVTMYQVQPALCNSTPGFNVETNGHTSACLWWSTTLKIFSDAKADCMAKGTILATFKTYEKFALLQAKGNRIFIGLDNMTKEGEYRWHDDDSVMDMNYSKYMWSPGDPNNWNNQENCISLWEQYKLLMDISCMNAQLYVCEK
ncbi:hypothetical protein Btru_012497, partial [Bulinus truncatus]